MHWAPAHATGPALPGPARLWLNEWMSDSHSPPLHALVLAGSRRAEIDTVARHAGVSCKAFAPVAGRPMVERVVQSLLLEPRIERIDVALPDRSPRGEEARELTNWVDKGLVHCRESAATPTETVAHALSRTPDGHRLVVTTGDHALLSSAILSQFLDSCDAASDRNALVGLVPCTVLEARFPAMRRTGLRLREGRYAGCNLFMFLAGAGADSLVSFWSSFEALRKSPWRMARAFGPLMLLRYMLGRLTLSQAMNRIGACTGARVGAVVLDIAEAAFDVDTPGQLMQADNLARES